MISVAIFIDRGRLALKIDSSYGPAYSKVHVIHQAIGRNSTFMFVSNIRVGPHMGKCIFTGAGLDLFFFVTWKVSLYGCRYAKNLAQQV